MNDLLAKLMAKKGADDEMDPDYKSSKLAVLQQLKDEMSKMMAGDLHGAAGLKKVTVAAPDADGLKDGLAKAQDLMGKGEVLDDDSHEGELDDGDEAPEADDHEHEADDAEGGMNVDEMSPEEAKALLKQLLATK